MLEAKLDEAKLFKQLLDSIKELVTDANFECNEEGLQLQAMDNSHVALVAVKLKNTGFTEFRCDRPMPLGVNLASLVKVLKCSKDDDQVTLTANDQADVLQLRYEPKNSDRVAEYEMKLMDIDTDTLGIPDTDYDAHVSMSSTEFARICRDLSQLGESVKIEVNKDGVRFTSEGESANGNVLLRNSERAAAKMKAEGSKSGSKKSKVKKEEDDDEEDVKMNGDDEDEDEDEVKVKKEKKSKKDDDDEEEDDGQEPESEDEEEERPSKKRKRAGKETAKPNKKAKKDEEEDEGVVIFMNQHVNLSFSLKYLVNFSKSSPLCKRVELKMSNEVPLLVNYDFGQGNISYYLAPKIGDD